VGGVCVLEGVRGGGMVRGLGAGAVGQFFALRYVPDPLTVFAGAHKLPPAHWCLVQDGRVRTERYWSLSFARVDHGDEQAQRQRALELLDEATRIRLMGEVPLAPFLSGGVDSYAVVDSMTRTLGKGVAACTIGFDDPAVDERPAARESAAACGARLREDGLQAHDLLDLDSDADGVV